MKIKHRAASARSYRPSARYPDGRPACEAGGRRVMRTFKKLAAARPEAERIVRELARARDALRLTPTQAPSALLALEQLAELARARQTDPDTLRLEEARNEIPS